MFRTDIPLMSAKQPAFQQAGHPMASWQKVLTERLIFTDNFMLVSQSFQSVITPQSVGFYQAPRFNHGLYGPFHGFAQDVGHLHHPYSTKSIPIMLRRNQYQRLSLSSPAPLPWSFTAHIRFIDIHSACKPVTPGPHHGPAELMKPRPCRFIASKPQNPLHSFCARAVLLAGKPPYRAKPRYQWLSRPLKYRPRRHGGLIVTLHASKQTRTIRPCFPGMASRTPVSIRPSQPNQILATRLIGRKNRLQFTNRLRIFIHASTLQVVATPVKGIPLILNQYQISSKFAPQSP